MHTLTADESYFRNCNIIPLPSYFSFSVETSFFGTCHVKVTMSCLITIFCFFWLQLLSELLYSWESLLSSDRLTLAYLLILLGILHLIGTLGISCNSPSLCAVLLLLPLCYGGALTGIILNNWVNSDRRFSYYPLSPIAFIIIWGFLLFALFTFMKYREYIRRLADVGPKEYKINMFSNRIFGTPPTEFSRIEIPRCSKVSESHLDDIFGSYDKDVLI